MKVHLSFSTVRHLEEGKKKEIWVDITMSGDAGLIEEVIKLLKAEGFEVS